MHFDSMGKRIPGELLFAKVGFGLGGIQLVFNQNDYNCRQDEVEVHMAVWQVQEAKTRLSEVIEEANSKGPQFITRHGSERAVILSVKDYQALTAHKPDLREYLLGGPKVDRFEVPRSRDKGRKVTL
jgi:antitoxin Phd